MREKIRLGFKLDGSPLHYKGDGHLILTAPTRSGKTTDFLAALGLTFRGSLIVVDPKAQLAAITKRRREQFGPVKVLNPFQLFHSLLGDSDSFNPFTILKPGSLGFVADCDAIAEGFIVSDPKGENSHFTDSARQLYSGGIMHLMTCPAFPDSKKNLAYLYDRISREPLSFATQAIETGTDLVKQRLNRFADPKTYEGREIPSIISVATRQTAFIGIEAIGKSLSGPSFDWRSLKKEPTTIYLTLPTEYVEPAGKWFRLIIASALKVLLREPEDDDTVPILAILDEFSTCIGQLSIMETAMSLAAGYGLQLLPVLQDLNQLKKHYPTSFESFLANSDVQIYCAPRDPTTAEYVSKLSGEKEVRVPSESLNDGGTPAKPSGSVGISWGRTVVPELRLHDLFRLPRDKAVCFHAGEVLMFSRASYFDETRYPEFKGMYDRDPYYREGRI